MPKRPGRPACGPEAALCACPAFPLKGTRLSSQGVRAYAFSATCRDSSESFVLFEANMVYIVCF